MKLNTQIWNDNHTFAVSDYVDPFEIKFGLFGGDGGGGGGGGGDSNPNPGNPNAGGGGMDIGGETVGDNTDLGGGGDDSGVVVVSGVDEFIGWCVCV